MGEVASAIPLLTAIREQSPETPLYLSTATVAGRQFAKRQTEPLVDDIFYAPIDFTFAIRRTLRRIKPSLLVVLETEIWPVLYLETKAAGAALILANARISDRTWPRYRRLKALFQPLLTLPNLIVPQTQSDARRFLELGAPTCGMAEPANLKYDAAASGKAIDINTGHAHPIWIAASTVGPDEGGSSRHNVVEESLVIDAFRQLAKHFPQLLLILAPRQPFRFDQVAGMLTKAGIPFQRRSALPGDQFRLPGVLLLDTVGELALLYHLADVVFVGGSIAPRGGHNILEPAAAAKPIVVGPNMQNFQAVADDFLAASALQQLKPGETLFSAILPLLQKPERARRMGQRASALLQEKRGAADWLVPKALGLSSIHRFRGCRSTVVRLSLRSLAAIWEHGGQLKRRSAEPFASQRQKLRSPVISIGGITVGGSGKTPFTNYLAGMLARSGHRPGILTRGYRRRIPAKQVIALPGAQVAKAFTGDEAQIYLRNGIAAIGIAADRYQAALTLLQHYPADVLLLDDGFQHARLPRDLDIVLIDGLDPFGDGEVVPDGRLREPLSALCRADVFVVTRARSSLQLRAIKQELANFNPRAPVLEAPLRVKGWRDAFTGTALELAPGTKVFAFCGLGNPDNFWTTLKSLRLNIVECETFPDHHFYKPAELRSLQYAAESHNAEFLVTTEKDLVNLPDAAHSALGSLPLAWLEIELYCTDEGLLSDLVHKATQRAVT